MRQENHRETYKVDLEALKKALPFTTLLKADGRKVERVGQGWKCLCPFHPEKTPSFSIVADNNHATCFGCGWKGDIIEYQKTVGKMDFGEAVKALQTRNLKSDECREPKPMEADRSGIVEHVESRRAASDRLHTEPHLFNKVANERGWAPETIQRLAQEGSLGWYGDAIGYHYPTGLKCRGKDKAKIRWEYGTAASLWRENLIRPGTPTVYITEGEPDAITLIDLGFEDGEGAAVVASPGATTIPAGSIQELTGKKVILGMDNDPAGEQATAAWIAALSGKAKAISKFDLKMI